MGFPKYDNNHITVYNARQKIILLECCADFGVKAAVSSYDRKSIEYFLSGHPSNVYQARQLYFDNIIKNRKRFGY